MLQISASLFLCFTPSTVLVRRESSPESPFTYIIHVLIPLLPFKRFQQEKGRVLHQFVRRTPFLFSSLFISLTEQPGFLSASPSFFRLIPFSSFFFLVQLKQSAKKTFSEGDGKRTLLPSPSPICCLLQQENVRQVSYRQVSCMAWIFGDWILNAYSSN